ncbi:hypothetical protein D1007_06017 [Hordeum vulgare]|nr:hypothetical protein D1007_06017 [Hordeum vulgare]
MVPETSARSDLCAFKLFAWKAEPTSIPTLRWMAMPERGLVETVREPRLLQYKVLIHLDSVTNYDDSGKPQLLEVSPDRRQSGVPSEGRINDGAVGGTAPTRLPWQFDARDARRGGAGHGRARSSLVHGAPAITRENSHPPTIEDKMECLPRGLHCVSRVGFRSGSSLLTV